MKLPGESEDKEKEKKEKDGDEEADFERDDDQEEAENVQEDDTGEDQEKLGQTNPSQKNILKVSVKTYPKKNQEKKTKKKKVKKVKKEPEEPKPPPNPNFLLDVLFSFIGVSSNQDNNEVLKQQYKLGLFDDQCLSSR